MPGSAAVDRVLAALEARGCRPKPRPNGNGWTFHCPCELHGDGDRNASGSLAAGDDGRALLHCFAGGQAANICATLGLELGELYDTPAKPKRSRKVELAPAEDPDFRPTDGQNADLFAKEHKCDLRFVHDIGAWFVFTGTHWKRDDAGEVMRRARETVRYLYLRGSTERDPANRQRIIRHALRSEQEPRLSAMLKLARHHPELAITSAALDRDAWLLNCENGTLDLRTGELGSHKADDFITHCLPVAYEPAAKAQLWQRFLERVLVAEYSGKVDERATAELRRYVQRAIGYSLTASTREQCLFLLHGRGRNGKSTFIETILSLFGTLAQSVPFATLLVKHGGDGIPNDIARLRGVRFAAAVESDAGRRLAEARVKQITGGDTLSARFMRGEFFDFRPTHKLWLAANHKPSIHGTDLAIWRRIKLVPFTVTIPEEECDPDLKEKLLRELPGILAWAVEGCREWRAQGLGSSDAVTLATAEYRGTEDVFGRFAADRLEFGESAYISSKELATSYREWAAANAEPELSAKRIAELLQEHNENVRMKRSKRERGWGGVCLAG
jgi:putative DNA primase/helicase